MAYELDPRTTEVTEISFLLDMGTVSSKDIGGKVSYNLSQGNNFALQLNLSHLGNTGRLERYHQSPTQCQHFPTSPFCLRLGAGNTANLRAGWDQGLLLLGPLLPSGICISAVLEKQQRWFITLVSG